MTHSTGSSASRRARLMAFAMIALILLMLGGEARADSIAFPRRETFGSSEVHSAALALGDLNRDGALDMVVGSDNLIPVNGGTPGYVYLNDGVGAFYVGLVACGTTPNVRCFGDPTLSVVSLALGDLDADGDLDIIAGYSDAGVRSMIFRNDGSGAFDAGTAFGPSGLFTTALAIADLDGANGLDLIIGASSGQNRIYLNDGTGSFTAGDPFGTGSDKTVSLAIGDVDGVNGLDIIAGNSGEQSVLYFNDGTGGFATGAITCGITAQTGCVGGASDATTGVALGRLDADADLDLVVIRNGAANRRYLNDGTGNFLSVADFGVAGGATRTLAMGDFDRDADLDVATGEAGTVNELYVNDGTGALSLLASFGSTVAPSAMRAGDIDGDGDLDLALSNGGLQNEIYLNSGAGSFAESDVLSFGGFAGPALRVAVGDLDSDGVLDVVLLRENLQPLIIALDAQGVPARSVTFGEPGPRYSDLALGDLDGDADLDIVLASIGRQNLVLFNQGVGSGVFYSGAISCGVTAGVACFGSGDDPTYSVALADVNGDGPLDIVAGNGSTAWSSVYLNQGGVFFQGRTRCDGSDPQTVVCLGDENIHTRSVAAGDLDSDGDADLVLGNEGQANQIFLNDGSGAFSAGSTFGSGTDTTLSIALGDLNGDGRLDIAAGNYQDQSAIFFNQGGASFVSSPALCRVGADVACFGSGLDPIQTLVAADMDSDGDLDLIAGQFGGQSAVYVNDGTGSLAARRTFGGASAQATSLATGDLDNDGDQDLVVGRADQASLIYRNAEYGASLSAFVAPQISVRTPGPVARPTGSASATIINTPVISVSYRLSRPVAAVVGTYSLDGGGSWLPAITSAGLTQIAAPQPGSDGSYSYAWDTFASGFFGQSDTVVFRLEAYPATSDFPGADAGSQQQPYIAAQTYPFRARGTQVRVLDEDGQPVSGAVVYRLEAGQSRGGTPLSDTSGTPFQTAANGYLQGRGLLTPGDRIVALVPHVISDTFTLYDTSAPVTSAGPQMSAVTNSGIQTLTVKASNPLLLFDLEIALEWDARSDSAFLARLSDDLERTSEILYDWSDGQIALGDITLYHDARRIYYDDGWDMWSYANVRLFASNGLRPNADRGGIVVTNTLDPDLLQATEPPYVPGQVRMAATWNRFGDSSGTIGEDWPRTLAHELSHYLLFLDDNYLGLDAEGVLIPVSGCPGAMADPYRDDYSEFHPAGVEWEQNANCQLTLSEVESNRADWASILGFYPKAGLQAPASYDANSGPGVLPLNLGQISAAPVLTATNALSAPFFSLEVESDGATESYVAGSSARAFLFQRAAGGDTPWLIDLGAPVVDRVEARGAAPGDHVCVFEIEAQEQGCVQVTTGNQPLQLAATPGWRPEVVVTPVTSSTLQLVVTNLAEDDALAPAVPATLTARLYPIDRASPPALSFTLPRGMDGRYAAIVQLDQPTFGGYLLISADDRSGRVAVVDYALGGNPGRKWAGTAPRGNPGRKWAGTTPRSNPGRKWAGTAPVLSGDGQAILYTKAEFAEGEFYAIQTASVPDVPTWATRVGHAYQVTATDNAPALDAASISIGYLSRDVPDGAESYLGLFYLDDTTWLPLDTRQNEAANLLSAPLQGPGLYAIFASVRLPALDGVGWHQFAYPITGIRPISDALSSISGDYTMVYRDTGGDLGARWQLYAPSAPAYVSDLEALRFAENYAIYITTTTTIRLRPAAATTTSTMAVPATIYGSLKTESGFAADVEVTAKVGTVLCGRTQTKQQNTTGEIVFSVQVEADSVATVSGCGALGRSVQLFYNGQVLGDPIAWDNTRLSIFSMVNGAPDVRVYLPLLRK